MTAQEGNARRRKDEILVGAVVVASIWLGWQVIRELSAARMPVELAIRTSPNSASVLSRAAESEFAAERFENASVLAKESLTKAPFNVRALRVAGLAAAEAGDRQSAEQMLTLAGNWSLRDDPSHAWLTEHLLRRGNYGLAFAHADTLARRRVDIRPQIFNLFRTAGEQDPRALPALVSLLQIDPLWRGEFLTYLSRTPTGLALSANLALALERTSAPYDNAELSQLYTQMMNHRLVPGMKLVREALDRPSRSTTIQDASFPEEATYTPAPFKWELPSNAGILSEILPDEVRPNESALRVQYDGFAVDKIADQFIQLQPGRYRLTGEARAESGELSGRLAWRVICFETNAIIAESVSQSWARGRWHAFEQSFTVPAENCSAQWLRLEPLPTNTRSRNAVWYDRLAIVAAP